MIKLGSIVKDTYTGFEGMAVGRTVWLYGCVRIAVEPGLDKDGKPQSSSSFDEQRIEVITAAEYDSPPEKIKLGSKVRDKHTGFEGTAIGRTVWLHAGAVITIEPYGFDKDGKPRDQKAFEEERIELVEQKSPIVSKHSSATAGGPERDPARRVDPSR